MSLPDDLAGAAGTLVRPEHVGENRCVPCTVVNGVAVAAAVGVLAPIWAPLAAAVAVGGALAVALRGYVVPYTPQFAPRLVAPLPIDFDHGGRGSEAADARQSASLAADPETTDGPADEGERVTRALIDGGVLVADAPAGSAGGGADPTDPAPEPELRPSEAFYEAWEAAIDRLRDAPDPALAAAAADAAPFAATGRVEDGGVVLDGRGDDEGRFAWLSRPVAVVETAAVRAMADSDVPPSLRPAAARPLRLFTPTCPVCGGRPVETTVSDCCGGTMGVYDTPEQAVLACEDCDAVVYEF
jgi:hypothetical protein